MSRETGSRREALRYRLTPTRDCRPQRVYLQAGLTGQFHADRDLRARRIRCAPAHDAFERVPSDSRDGESIGESYIQSDWALQTKSCFARVGRPRVRDPLAGSIDDRNGELHADALPAA